MSREFWAASIRCSERPQSSSPTEASKISIVRSVARIRWEAQTALQWRKKKTKKMSVERNLFIDLWTYCRSSLGIPSYRLCNKFDVLSRLGLKRLR